MEDEPNTHDEPEELMQICEIVGDPDNSDGWLGIPVRIVDKGRTPYRHVRLFCDLQMAVQLFNTLHSLIHMEVAEEATRLHRQIRKHTRAQRGES